MTSKYIRIPISEGMRVKAEEMASKRKIDSSPHYHDKDEYIGCLAELCIRRLLYEKKRRYNAEEVYNQSDGGVDVQILAGSVDVKGSGINPGENLHLFCKPGKTAGADYYAQVFIVEEENVGYFAGMETKENLMNPKNKMTTKSDRYNMELEVFGVKVKDLSIKPTDILTDAFTAPENDAKKQIQPKKRREPLTIPEIQARLLEMGREAGQKHRDIIKEAEQIFNS